MVRPDIRDERVALEWIHRGGEVRTLLMGDFQTLFRGNPRGLTCWETCPDMCVEKGGKCVLFQPEMRELRDTQNGC